MLKKVTFQAVNYTNDSTGNTAPYKSVVVPIKDFCGAKVIVTGSNTDISNNTVYFQNNILLQPYICSQLGIAQYPYMIEFKCNENEIDQTQLSLRIPKNVIVTIIFKFYKS